MNDRPDFQQAARPDGLCADCRHARRIVSAKGSQFLLCERSMTDERFVKYPALPVVRCVGYERRSVG